MAQRKSFLLRLPPELYEELNRWASDELRSLNSQIEYTLREAVRKQRRKNLRQNPPQRNPQAKADGADGDGLMG